MKAFLILIFSLVLVGCGSTKIQEVIKVEYKYSKVELPKQLITECKPPKPMSEKEYLTMSVQDRETYLSQYILTLYGEIKKCETKVMSIKKLVEKQNELMGHLPSK